MHTVKQLEQMLKEARRQEREQVTDYAALTQNHANWTYASYPRQFTRFNNQQIDGVMVTKKLDPDMVEAFTKEHQPLHITVDTEPKGAFYYRTEEGILATEGLGTQVLHTPKLCSEAEWGQIVKGVIPEKFRK